MNSIRSVIENFATALPFILTLATVSVGLLFFDWFLLRRHAKMLQEQRTKRQVVMVLLTGVAIILLTLSLPLNDQSRNQVLGLLGLLLSGVIGISSTTFVSNAMAGLMLRSVKSFRTGDFLRVDKHFGRVTEQGLFHTEIQTEDRDLTTLPNLYLVNNPTTVVHSSGTIVSATVSLGYDVPRMDIESCLLEAAQQTALEEPFVQVRSLGDYSVVYRIAGFLTDSKSIITVRSNLRKYVMDCLHSAGIEIVSPTFMNQRQLPVDQTFVPSGPSPQATSNDKTPERLMFEKAEIVERVQQLKLEMEETQSEIVEMEAMVKKETAKENTASLNNQIERRKQRLNHLSKRIAWIEERMED